MVFDDSEAPGDAQNVLIFWPTKSEALGAYSAGAYKKSVYRQSFHAVFAWPLWGLSDININI